MVTFPLWTHHCVDDGPTHHKQACRKETEKEGVLEYADAAPDLTNRARRYSLARIWKMAVKKKRPPFTRVKSWQRKMMKEVKQKMVARTIRACTACSHSERQKNINKQTSSNHWSSKLFYLCVLSFVYKTIQWAHKKRNTNIYLLTFITSPFTGVSSIVLCAVIPEVIINSPIYSPRLFYYQTYTPLFNSTSTHKLYNI